MKKQELEILGLSREQIKAVQIIHSKDMVELREKLNRDRSKAGLATLRESITAMLCTIHKGENLRRILSYVANVYYWETHPNKKGAVPDATNTPDGEAEKQSSPASFSASMIPETEEIIN